MTILECRRTDLRRASGTLGIALLGLHATSCNPGDSQRASGDPGEVPDRMVQLEEFSTLGERDDPSFFDVRSVLLVDDAFIVVEGTPPRLRKVDPSGEVTAEAGAQGDGPGEFRRITSVARHGGDSIFVFDGGARRVSIYDGDLELTRAFQLVGDDAGMLAHALPGLQGVVAVQAAQVAPGQAPPGPYRPPLELLHFSETGEFLGSLLEIPGPEIHFGEGGGFVRPPLPRATVLAVTEKDVFVGTGEALAIDVVQGDGLREQHVLPSKGWRMLTQQDKSQILDVLATNATDEVAASRLRASAEISGFPDALPPYTGLLVDDEGRLWVAHFADPRSDVVEWESFSHAGERLGGVVFPRDFKMMDLRDGVAAGIRVDEAGIERVTAVRIHPGPP